MKSENVQRIAQSLEKWHYQQNYSELRSGVCTIESLASSRRREPAPVTDITPESINSNSITKRLVLTILQDLLEKYSGCVGVVTWDRSRYQFGAKAVPDFTIAFNCSVVFTQIMLRRNPLVLADAYFKSHIHIDGNLNSALSLRHHLSELKISTSTQLSLIVATIVARTKRIVNDTHDARSWNKTLKQQLRLKSDKATNRKAISFHYDVSKDFYRLSLDKRMVYSCAYFHNTTQSLEQAQCNKLDHICRKLRLKPGEKLLEIGCGWGGLMSWAARHYGVEVHGITLSERQYHYVERLIKEQNLGGRVSVELLDYRDLSGEPVYDKAVSVGMCEHVGLKNLPRYFSIVNAQLKPSGLFLNHGITMDTGGWKNGVGTKFINTYVFPDGQLETISTVQDLMECEQFEIHDVENLRIHYAMTLRDWVKRLESNHQQALAFVDEPTYRVGDCI